MAGRLVTLLVCRYCVVASVVLAGCQHYRPQPLAAQQELSPPAAAALRVQAQQLTHPLLRPVDLDWDHGLSPDAAAVLAVLLNPKLRAVRDARGLADAQLLQAGILPNPQLSLSLDRPAFGVTAGTVTGYGIGLSWDVQQVITRAATVRAARRQREAVDLDIAWQEWQAAEAAKMAVYQLSTLDAQTTLAAAMDDRLAENLAVTRRALATGQMTELDLAAAEAASHQAHAGRLAVQRQAAQQRLTLNQLLGLPPDAALRLAPDITLPCELKLPPIDQLFEDLEKRRLDLVALQRGYASQESLVRAAILAQFPSLNLGVNRQRDTGDVGTRGGGLTLDLPVFDRHQGAIAQERATRQRLSDEYTARVFAARADIARLVDDARWLTEQIEAAQGATPALERLVETYREAVRGGQADVLSYYTAWNHLAQSRIDLLHLQEQLMETQIGLELATGRYRVGE
jgi:cobalt-zinc-cadmium efflux system outer membrane protein